MIFKGFRQFFSRHTNREDISLEGRVATEEYITIRRSEWEACLQRIAKLETVVESQKAIIESQKAHIEELEEKLRLSSNNSSMPPSSNLPSVKKPPKKKRAKEKRGRGAQPGHRGKGRKLLSVEEVDSLVKCKPGERCECGGCVSLNEKASERKQIFEIPEVKPLVTEYQVFKGVCQESGYLI